MKQLLFIHSANQGYIQDRDFIDSCDMGLSIDGFPIGILDIDQRKFTLIMHQKVSEQAIREFVVQWFYITIEIWDEL